MSHKNTFAILIPTLNRWDLLFPALLMYSMDFPDKDIIIYDNGSNRIKQRCLDFVNLRGNTRTYPNLVKNITVLNGTGRNVGVSRAWNEMLELAFEKHTHAVVLNDDIYLGKNAHQISQLINFYHADIWISEPEYDWSAFILPKKTFEAIGKFDENLSLYCGDIDYLRRMQLYMPVFDEKPTTEVHRVPFLTPSVFRRSMTLLKDNSGKLHEKIEKDREYYRSKWGGNVGEEQFTIPFGTNE